MTTPKDWTWSTETPRHGFYALLYDGWSPDACGFVNGHPMDSRVAVFAHQIVAHAGPFGSTSEALTWAGAKLRETVKLPAPPKFPVQRKEP